MEEITISLTINKWMLYIVVVALFASFISNMMTLYVYYLKRQLAKEESKHENSGLNIPVVTVRCCKTCEHYQYNPDKDNSTCSAHNNLTISDALNASNCNKWQELNAR